MTIVFNGWAVISAADQPLHLDHACAITTQQDSHVTPVPNLYGGRSAEHDISVLSATNVLSALASEKYDAVPIFRTRESRWLLSTFENGAFAKPPSGTEVCFMPGGYGRAIAPPPEGAPYELPKIDMVFPVLHGPHGEDGTVQGMFEVARVPFAGCGLPGSANALDKDIAKRLFNEAGVPAARSVAIHRDFVPSFVHLKGVLGLPIVIKPACQGSSVGVSKVVTEADYEAALTEAFSYDRKLLAKEFIRGREIECAILEDDKGDLFVSRTGEIIPTKSHGFYTYAAKYIDTDGAALTVPADLPTELEDEIRTMALKAFRALGCDGMARADFFVTPDMRILAAGSIRLPGADQRSRNKKIQGPPSPWILELLSRVGGGGGIEFSSANKSRCAIN